MLRHVAGLAEIVENVDEALSFYRDVLGMTVEQRANDGYAMLAVPGILHFGIWDRRQAAKIVYGNEDQADRIPLGFTLEFEVDAADEASGRMNEAGKTLLHAVRTEPWGQKTFRMQSPSGHLLGFAETPWARRLATQLSTEAEPEAT